MSSSRARQVPQITPRAVAVFGGVDHDKGIDLRDWEAIRAWAERVAESVRGGSAATAAAALSHAQEVGRSIAALATDDEHSSCLRRARRSLRAESSRQLTGGPDECVSSRAGTR